MSSGEVGERGGAVVVAVGGLADGGGEGSLPSSLQEQQAMYAQCEKDRFSL